MQLSIPMHKLRLDVLLHERGLASSRAKAAALIMGGGVFVGGMRAVKPGMQVDSGADVEVRGGELPYVSRGGLKLQKALEFFGVSAQSRACIDCGASTGGFTDCLLQAGAKLVYAVDVGYGQFAWSLRNDPRVVTMERTNIRNVTPDMLAESPSLAVIDVSFISLRIVLPVVRNLLTENGEVICLIKPQFEAGRESVGKKGVVKDPQTHKEVLDAFLQNAANAGFCVQGLTFSPVKGPQGNIEYLGFLGSESETCIDTNTVVAESYKEFNNEQQEDNTVP